MVKNKILIHIRVHMQCSLGNERRRARTIKGYVRKRKAYPQRANGAHLRFMSVLKTNKISE